MPKPCPTNLADLSPLTGATGIFGKYSRRLLLSGRVFGVLWMGQSPSQHWPQLQYYSQLPHTSSDNPEELWDALKAIHTTQGVASCLTLQRTFWKLTKQPNQSMKSFIADARQLKHQLGDIGVIVSDEQMILVLTGGLPPSYDHLVVSLDATPEDDLTVEYVINCLLNEETHQENPSAVKKRENVAFSAIPAKRGKRPVSEITCYCCNEKGHYIASCPKNPASANYKPEANTAYSSSATGDEDTICLIQGVHKYT
jgi:hypothetical protein